MRKLPIPTVKMNEYIDTISNYRNIEKREKFKDYQGYILLQERLYFLKAINGTFNQVPAVNPIEDIISTEEFMDLYNKKLVGGNGRTFYNTLFNSTQICPTCLLRGVAQLDHFLPKSKYPLYSVSPLNLVPICEKCNGVKSSKDANTFTFIHPYFNEIDDSRWLKAKIHITSKIIGFNYYIEVPDILENHLELKKVISSHFEALDLFTLYNSKAGELHASMLSVFRNMYKSNGEQVVYELLKAFYIRGCEIGTCNSFEAVFYRALIEYDYINTYLIHNLK